MRQNKSSTMFGAVSQSRKLTRLRDRALSFVVGRTKKTRRLSEHQTHQRIWPILSGIHREHCVFAVPATHAPLIRPKAQSRTFTRLRVVLVLLLIIAGSAPLSAQQNKLSKKKSAAPQVDQKPADTFAYSNKLKAHVDKLAVELGERNLQNRVTLKALNDAADYVEGKFKEFGYTPTRQTFKCRGIDCHNIACEIKGTERPDEIFIVGAHYDSAPGTPGANDNGSGTAAMLVIAEKLKDFKPKRTLRFVAFTNEEPPYFQNRGEMGSWVYAEMCRKEDQNIVGVISLETMGYFTNAAKSQKYPFPLNLRYPSTGNFIGFVSNTASAQFQRKILKAFKANSTVPSESASLPQSVQGVGWSDHWSFWQEGYVGIMITDTAPFRYPHYHETTDTPDKINFPVFSKVVEGLVEPVKQFADEEKDTKK